MSNVSTTSYARSGQSKRLISYRRTGPPRPLIRWRTELLSSFSKQTSERPVRSCCFIPLRLPRHLTFPRGDSIPGMRCVVVVRVTWLITFGKSIDPENIGEQFFLSVLLFFEIRTCYVKFDRNVVNALPVRRRSARKCFVDPEPSDVSKSCRQHGRPKRCRATPVQYVCNWFSILYYAIRYYLKIRSRRASTCVWSDTVRTAILKLSRRNPTDRNCSRWRFLDIPHRLSTCGVW